ncbi:ski oncogene-like [Branchiostoma floridae]|uniref:Ski oncogene-like n=1 Tax=Branchiostoma floridae TaxID=7739 RepID=A0A9J7N7S3_BRAFL|nr:ski oncogene-like [Branchiostoma floridae]
MEQPTAVFNANLHQTLKHFQASAMSSLSGPAGFAARWAEAAKLRDIAGADPDSPGSSGEGGAGPSRKDLAETFAARLASSVGVGPQHFPVFIPQDRGSAERAETLLEGETISCFIVGGEKRLCLPQILNSVLRDFSLQQINVVCDELHIFCSRCSPEQLETLKVMGILPYSAASCGLITKTDAERLCNELLHRRSGATPQPTPTKPRDKTKTSFKVYHECFGKCKGVFCPDLYESPFSQCIECTDCHGAFSPQKFVCHSHKAQENRTCHWGFDSANWRSYVLLSKDQDTEEFQEALEDMKAKFDFMNRFKRKQSGSQDEVASKRARSDEAMKFAMGHDAMITSSWTALHGHLTPIQRLSAFRPWSPSSMAEAKDLYGRVAMRLPPPLLSSGPPVLLHPERVVPYTGMGRYDNYVPPNVALAPTSSQLSGSAQTAVKVEEGSEVAKVEEGSEVATSTGEEKHQQMIKREVMETEGGCSEETEQTASQPETTETRQPDQNMAAEVDMSALSAAANPPAATIPVGTISGKESGSELDSSGSVEQELELVRSALDGGCESKEAKEKLLHELAKIRMRQEERLSSALQAKKSLQQELDFLRVAKKEKLREAAEAKRNLRKEIERLRVEHERKLRETNESKQRLKRELELVRSKRLEKFGDVNKSKTKLRAQIEELKERMAALDAENQQLRHELEGNGGSKEAAQLPQGQSESDSVVENQSNAESESVNVELKNEKVEDSVSSPSAES